MSREFTENREKNRGMNSNDRRSDDSNRELSPYTENPGSSAQEKESDKAHDLFALFTADIIRENKVFTR